ncbi:MAG: hypothetical protein FJ240_03810 [Nitrospira sp.]|nr:hypothetical protein [Nitrospira sp.]
MSSVRISNELTSCIYYLTFTVRKWYCIFDRHNRFQILADSENPVRRQYVKKPGDWLWSSANPESDIVIESVVL